MKKTTQNFWIVAAVLVTISVIPSDAHAYLIPLIGGLGWLIAVIIGGVVAASAFVWVHVVKFKQWMKKDKKEESTQEEVK